MNELILVNAKHPLLTVPNVDTFAEIGENIRLDRRVAVLLERLIDDIGGRGRVLPVSGWRSREEQRQIWEDTLKKDGREFAEKYVALPGCSEHETGLAVDLALAGGEIDPICPSFPYDGICGEFRARAARYGFIERYPRGKEAVTGIAHEPWHFRFVGVPHASIIARRGMTLEEYIDALRAEPADGERESFADGGYAFRVSYYRGKLPAATDECRREISDDNCGGRIVTEWRRNGG